MEKQTKIKQKNTKLKENVKMKTNQKLTKIFKK